jgi:hypothetical protein
MVATEVSSIVAETIWSGIGLLSLSITFTNTTSVSPEPATSTAQGLTSKNAGPVAGSGPLGALGTLGTLYSAQEDRKTILANTAHHRWFLVSGIVVFEHFILFLYSFILAIKLSACP